MNVTLLLHPDRKFDASSDQLTSDDENFFFQELSHGRDREFTAVFEIAKMLGQARRVVRVDHQTNEGMENFCIESANCPGAT